MSGKHKELSEQLNAWWTTQTDFKTKKALAGFLKVHPDTLGEYFSGKSFPRWDIANRLFELTNIEYLSPDVGGDSSVHMVPQESPDAAASIEAPQESDSIAGPPGHPQEKSHFGKALAVKAGQPSGVALEKGGRHGERSVVISLQRTSCPFCKHDIAKFYSCAYCGQHFVWANVPLEDSEPVR
jgi:hypothetical protein